MAKIIAGRRRRRAPSTVQTSATSAARAPSPPSSRGNQHAEQPLLAQRRESLGGEAGVAVDRVGKRRGDLGDRLDARPEVRRRG